MQESDFINTAQTFNNFYFAEMSVPDLANWLISNQERLECLLGEQQYMDFLWLDCANKTSKSDACKMIEQIYGKEHLIMQRACLLAKKYLDSQDIYLVCELWRTYHKLDDHPSFNRLLSDFDAGKIAYEPTEEMIKAKFDETAKILLKQFDRPELYQPISYLSG